MESTPTSVGSIATTREIPGPDVFVAVEQPRHIGVLDPGTYFDQITLSEATLGDGFFNDIDCNTLSERAGDVLGDVQRVLLRTSSERLGWHILCLRSVVDSAAAQQHVEIHARALHGTGDANDGVAFFLLGA